MPASLSFHIFPTTLGACGIVWSEAGLYGVLLPEPDAETLRARLLRRYPAAMRAEPNGEMQRAIDAIAALLAGDKRDLRDIIIDDRDTPDFNRRVYAVARAIPPGETLTYGDIAERLGDKALARAVGQALGENPCPIVMPCHRVLAANGRSGGFSGTGGVATKLRLLTIEGAQPGGPDLFGDLPLAAAPGRR
jgi:methylated-DNA-[protein]-cysteine S-methyltransferase